MSCVANDCGCGGGYGCDSVGVSTASKPGFERPRFFGGMLLNETDLQSAIDYVVGKRKLTNRFIFGPGVVCGLNVAADPCDDGKVDVQPGYALDCCGNDIFADCPESVDIMRLVTELRREQGDDCGDPCDDEDDDERHYYLYIRYAETMTDPVAPYSTDNCDVGDCEYSRVAEGYTFELRCDPFENEDSMFELIVDCFKDEAQFLDDVAKLKEIRSLSLAMTDANAITVELGEKAPTVAAFDTVDISDTAALKTLLRHSLAHVTNFDLAAAGGEKNTDLTKARRASNTARAMELLAKVKAAGEKDPVADADAEVIERLATLHETNLADMSPVDHGLAQLGLTKLSASQRIESLSIEMKNQLLGDFEARGLAGTTAYSELKSVQPFVASTGSLAEVEKLINALLALLQKCVCTNINPRCPSCTDLGVSLAKVTVAGCKVTDVCDLERRWVLSPRAIEYWLPVNTIADQLLPRLCCEPLTIDIDRDEPSKDNVELVLDELATSGQSLILEKVGSDALPLAGIAAQKLVNPRSQISPLPAEPIEGSQVRLLERRLQDAQRSLSVLSSEVAVLKEAAAATKGDGS